MELTTVADDEAVVHDGFDVRRYPGLEPDHVYEIDGFAFRTLARPAGEHLCTFATVNDVHFGEVECGIIEGLDIGPTFAVPEGETPYPEVMNRAAVAEIEAIDPTVVVVKGDLTSQGHRRGVPGLPRRLLGRSATGCTTSGATTRATTTPPSRPTRRSWSTCPAPAWR